MVGRHCPLASQVTDPEQLPGSSWFVITVVQVPLVFAQERHAVVHAVVQQRPSTQFPLAHWCAPEASMLSPEQTAPGVLSGWQVPPEEELQ